MSSPTAARINLGRVLRELREAADVSREDAARTLGCTVGKISKVETGKTGLRLAEVRELLNLYEAGPAQSELATEFARDASRRDPKRSWTSDWARSYIAWEEGAAELREYQAELIPGLLQTEDYARVVAMAAQPGRDPRETDRLVAAKMQRQQSRLNRDDGPLLWVVLNETVFLRQIGSAATWSAQLHQVLDLAEHPNITVQVLPLSSGAHPAMGASWVHVRLRSPADGEMIYSEGAADAAYLDKPHHIEAYTRVWETLISMSLTPPESHTMIRERFIDG